MANTVTASIKYLNNFVYTVSLNYDCSLFEVGSTSGT